MLLIRIFFVHNSHPFKIEKKFPTFAASLLVPRLLAAGEQYDVNVYCWFQIELHIYVICSPLTNRAQAPMIAN